MNIKNIKNNIKTKIFGKEIFYFDKIQSNSFICHSFTPTGGTSSLAAGCVIHCELTSCCRGAAVGNARNLEFR